MKRSLSRRIKEKAKIYIYNSLYYCVERHRLGKNRKLKKSSEKLKVCFVIQRTEIFSSTQSIYNFMRSNPKYDVMLLVLPRFDHTENKVDVSTIPHNVEFAKTIGKGIEIINPYNEITGEFEKLDKYNFDVIFMGLPYQREYPPEYNFAYLSSLARLCYVPYGSSFADGIKMIRTMTPKPLLSYVDYIFCDGDKTYKYCYSKLKYCKNIDGKKVAYNIGYPRFDLIDRCEMTDKSAKTFLWLPRWTTPADDNEGSTFLVYKDVLLDFFEEHSDLNMIIRPHPLMFDNYVAKGFLTKEAVEKYKARVEALPNVMFDPADSYADAFEKADCLIADYTSIVIEYFVTGKPVIYLSDVEKIEPKISNAFYTSAEANKTLEFIEQLAQGNDPKKQAHMEALETDAYKKDTYKRIVRVLEEK